jgi:flagellar basal-body rod protein FlgB
MSILFDKTLQTLGAGLTVRRHAQGVVAGNIANADTPGYKARKVDFSEVMKKVANQEPPGRMKRTSARHVVGSELEGGSMAGITTIDDSPGRVDGNNVVMEDQISTHVANALEYKAVASLTRKKFALMRYAIDQNSR